MSRSRINKKSSKRLQKPIIKRDRKPKAYDFRGLLNVRKFGRDAEESIDQTEKDLHPENWEYLQNAATYKLQD
jgi:hypothetical protein